MQYIILFFLTHCVLDLRPEFTARFMTVFRKEGDGGNGQTEGLNRRQNGPSGKLNDRRHLPSRPADKSAMRSRRDAENLPSRPAVTPKSYYRPVSPHRKVLLSGTADKLSPVESDRPVLS